MASGGNSCIVWSGSMVRVRSKVRAMSVVNTNGESTTSTMVWLSWATVIAPLKISDAMSRNGIASITAPVAIWASRITP